MKLILSSLLLLQLILITYGSVIDLPIKTLKSMFKPSQIYATDEDSPIVSLPIGKVRGKRHVLHGGHKLNFFQGIHYGVAERFAHSKPVAPWTDVYDATYERNHCPQADFFVKQAEDCLYLNVWQPITESTSNNTLKPVMFWIFGGGFSIGSNNLFLYDGSYIAAIGDVIVVTIDYRLGPLGYLYLGNEKAPGNQGVHDQILALKWVQENIKSFGGDPNRVTVFGESAGSFSISMLILSPMAKGLFHRAIMQSGAILDSYKFSPEYSLQKTKNFAKEVNCGYDDVDLILGCLKSKSVHELIKHSHGLRLPEMFAGIHPIIMWGDFNGIMPDKPGTLLKNFNTSINSVDLISGFLHDELAEILMMVDPEVLNPLKHYTKQHLRDKLKELFHTFGLPNVTEVSEYYLKEIPDKHITLHQARELLTDIISEPIIQCPVNVYGALLSQRPDMKDKKLFSYRFDHRSPFMNIIGCFKYMGVCHGVDVPYTFGMPLHTGERIAFTAVDRVISFNLIKAWTDFAKTGNPEHFGEVEWPESIVDRTAKSIQVRQMGINEKSSIFTSEQYNKHCNYLHQYIYK